MAKTSKIVSQKETPSTSRPATDQTVLRTAIEEPVPEPTLKMFIPGGARLMLILRSKSPPPYQAGARRSLGLPKDVQMRPPSGCDDFPTESPAPKQGEEKKRKKGSEFSEPGENDTKEEADPDESEEDKILVARELSVPGERTSTEGGTIEANPSQTQEVDASVRVENPQDAVSAPPGVIDITGSPSFTDSMFGEAQAANERSNWGEGVQGANDPLQSFFDGVDSIATGDVTRLVDLEVPRRSLPSGTENQEMMNEVESSCLFNEAQQTLNRASVLHHETFLRYQEEPSLLDAEAKEPIEKRDMYKLLNAQREEEAKSLWAELDAVQKEHVILVEEVKVFEVTDDEVDLVTNGGNPQFQQKIDRVDHLRTEMNTVKAETDEWRGMMDRLALEKETARAQLALAEAQLQVAKEKVEVQAKKVEELQSQLSSAASEQEIMAKELETAKLATVVVKVDADEMVAQYKANVEAAQGRLKDIIDYEKRQLRREALEDIHARGFALSAEIETAKGLKAEAKKLAYPEEEEEEEDSEGSDGPGGGEDQTI
ncbi:uncharacterized protein [Nicotiana tomentosiformis]|uniref:uncharacterized protein n=1 Tax=Nicotiana tomentosiformis TaxID=4098 RepID=UPI00388CA792